MSTYLELYTHDAQWSYSAQGVEKLVGTIKNTTSEKINVSSVRLWLGTLNGYVNSGTVFTGDGSAINTYVKLGEIQSISESVTTVVGTSGSGSNIYADTDGCDAYDFTLSSTLRLGVGETASLYISTPALSEGSTGSVLVMQKKTGGVYYDPVIDTTKVTFRCTWPSPGGTIYNPETGEVGTELSYVKDMNVNFKIPELTVSGLPDEHGEPSPYSWDGKWYENSNEFQNGGILTENRSYTLTTSQGSTATFTVTWTDGYSGKVLKTLSGVSYGSSINISDFPPNPTRDGYSFSGWFGNWSYITNNTTISAMWGTSKIWIYTKDAGWQYYKPKEADS